MGQGEFSSGQTMYCLKGCLDRAEGSPGLGPKGHTLSQGFHAEEGGTFQGHHIFDVWQGLGICFCSAVWDGPLPTRQESFADTTGM